MWCIIQIDFNNRHMMVDSGKHCKVTVDGRCYCIQEASPLDSKWYRHMFRGPDLHYEVGVCIKARWVVWVNGPFPVEEWSECSIARLGIHQHLGNHKFYVCDGGYNDGYQWAETPP